MNNLVHINNDTYSDSIFRANPIDESLLKTYFLLEIKVNDTEVTYTVDSLQEAIELAFSFQTIEKRKNTENKLAFSLDLISVYILKNNDGIRSEIKEWKYKDGITFEQLLRQVKVLF